MARSETDSINVPPVLANRSQAEPVSSSPRKKIFRALGAMALAALAMVVLVATTHPGTEDYISYWTAGKLLTHHSDPYSWTTVFAMEKAQGHLAPTPLIMRNPPWALFLAMPLGFADARSGLLLWMIACVACIGISAQLLDNSSKDRPLAFLFAPTLACLCSGQSSPFLLLGFTLFLHFHRSRPFLAGASLLLMAIKPHLFFVFWAVLLAECVYRRRFKIAAGFASALALATAFAMSFDPHVLTQYAAMLRASRLDHEFFPTLSMLFRLSIAPQAEWLLFVPSALAVIWALWFYSRQSGNWNWKTDGLLLMLVAMLSTPYSWFTDEIVLLPSIAFAVAAPRKGRFSGWILLGVNGVALYIVLFGHASLSSHAYVWTPLAWLLWFLYAARGFTRQVPSLTQVAAQEA